MQDDDLSGYETATRRAGYYLLPEAGYLRISGQDQVDFLQRQTTNNVHLLSPGRILPDVLTSSTARILDVFYLLQEPDSIGVITLPGRAEQTARFLKSRIFFMDKVSVEDASRGYSQVELLGPQAGEILTRIGVTQVPQPNNEITTKLAGVETQILALEPTFGLGYRLLFPAEALESWESALQDAGAALLSQESYHVLRVERGLPTAGSELNEEFTPLEAGLKAAISEDKGCYTGQEVIARQITYDKVTQHLCGLRLQGTVPPRSRVWAEGKSVGTATSIAGSPRLGSIALAILKRPYHEPGTSVRAGAQAETGIEAIVSPLPFIP